MVYVLIQNTMFWVQDRSMSWAYKWGQNLLIWARYLSNIQLLNDLRRLTQYHIYGLCVVDWEVLV
jgi:hypothetical protein